MKKIKIISIFGTRPEAIKMTPVIFELLKYPKLVESKVIVTAQHEKMTEQVISLFKIKVDYNLHIMQKNQTLAQITTLTTEKLEKIFHQEKPNLVLVQGDTTTAFISALVAFYHQISIGHIEAGLRTYNKYSPYPEEINRRLISHLADFHFAPTFMAKKNLLKEGITENSIFITGNTAIDTLFKVKEKYYNSKDKILESIESNKKIILVTAHRRENFGFPLKNICLSLLEISNKYPDVEIIYPVHLNPNVKTTVYEILKNNKRIHLIPPCDYFTFVKFLNRAYLILTDSGGIQEEAPSLGKPVLVLREVTERPEGVKAGVVKIIGISKTKIVEEVGILLTNKKEYRKMTKRVNPYGDGKASKRIVDIIYKEFGLIKYRKTNDFNFIPIPKSFNIR